MIVIFLQHINDSFKSHLFNTMWGIFAEYFEKILRPYVSQQQN